MAKRLSPRFRGLFLLFKTVISRNLYESALFKFSKNYSCFFLFEGL